LPSYVDLAPLLGRYGKDGAIEVLALKNLDPQSAAVSARVLFDHYRSSECPETARSALRATIVSLRFQAIETLLWFAGASWFPGNILQFQAGPGGRTSTLHEIAEALANKRVPKLSDSRWGLPKPHDWQDWVCGACFCLQMSGDDPFMSDFSAWLSRAATSYLDRRSYNAIKHGGRIGREFILPTVAQEAWEKNFDDFDEPLAYMTVGSTPNDVKQSYLFVCENESVEVSTWWAEIAARSSRLIVDLRLAALTSPGEVKIKISEGLAELRSELPGSAFMFTIGLDD